MGWIYRGVDIHKCKKPGWSPEVKKNDLWQCDSCGCIYKVTKVDTWGALGGDVSGSLQWEFDDVRTVAGRKSDLEIEEII